MTLPSTFRSFSRARALAGAIEEPAAPRGFAGAAGRRPGVVEEAIAVAAEGGCASPPRAVAAGAAAVDEL